MADNHTLVNRELSWLEFNRRVLEEAQDETVPLLERIKFLAIFSSNLDEFFMVRVAGLVRRMVAGFPVEGVGVRLPRQVLENTLDLAGQLTRPPGHAAGRNDRPARTRATSLRQCSSGHCQGSRSDLGASMASPWVIGDQRMVGAVRFELTTLSTPC